MSPTAPLTLAVLVSWGIAFFEYCLAVPANRIGRAVYSTAELKTMQEVITLVIFAGYRPCKRCHPLEATGRAPAWVASSG